jgi:hypothetical protein
MRFSTFHLAMVSLSLGSFTNVLAIPIKLHAVEVVSFLPGVVDESWKLAFGGKETHSGSTILGDVKVVSSVPLETIEG